MKTKWIATMAACLIMTAATFAQAQPDRPKPADAGGGPPDRDQRDGGGPPPPDGAGPGGGGGGRPPGMRPGPGGGRGPGMGGSGEGPMGQIGLLRGYLELVDAFSKMSKDPSTAGVAAVISANDLLKAKGQDAVINYFTKVLPSVKNEAVQRAIRLELITAYKDAGQQDKALEQMEILMTGASPSSEGAAR